MYAVAVVVLTANAFRYSALNKDNIFFWYVCMYVYVCLCCLLAVRQLSGECI